MSAFSLALSSRNASNFFRLGFPACPAEFQLAFQFGKPLLRVGALDLAEYWRLVVQDDVE
jgi:hypothetical protein